MKRPGEVTKPLIDEWLDDIVVVDEEAVADAMVMLMERAKLYVEGAGAVGVAALMSERASPSRTGATCVVLSGGNVDLGVVPGLIRRHETNVGRRLIVFARISDRPGGLARLLTLFAEQRRQPDRGRARQRRCRPPREGDGGSSGTRGQGSRPRRRRRRRGPSRRATTSPRSPAADATGASTRRATTMLEVVGESGRQGAAAMREGAVRLVSPPQRAGHALRAT